MGTNWAVRIFRGILWRLVRRTRTVVLRTDDIDSDPAVPEGYTLVRITGMSPLVSQDMAEAAMRIAGEPAGLTSGRFAHGDEFFGWLAGDEVVSFGWVTYRDRAVGQVPLAEASGRVFLYNFHTRGEYRGRGLYPSLLRAMRYVLGHEKAAEFVIDVNLQNRASARGIEKAGFLPLAQITSLTFFNRWCHSFKPMMLDMAGCSLFPNNYRRGHP